MERETELNARIAQYERLVTSKPNDQNQIANTAIRTDATTSLSDVSTSDSDSDSTSAPILSSDDLAGNNEYAEVQPSDQSQELQSECSFDSDAAATVTTSETASTGHHVEVPVDDLVAQQHSQQADTGLEPSPTTTLNGVVPGITGKPCATLERCTPSLVPVAATADKIPEASAAAMAVISDLSKSLADVVCVVTVPCAQVC